MLIQRTKDQVVRVAHSTHISASPADVWALIRPAEAALFLDPSIIRAFRVPGTPDGVGEMQGFIASRDGAEHVQLIEVVEEVPETHAVVRYVATSDPTARTSYRLTADASGTTLEYEHVFTVPGVHIKSIPSFRRQHDHAAITLLTRVKYILEEDEKPHRGRHRQLR